MRLKLRVPVALVAAVLLMSPGAAAAGKPVSPPGDVDCGSLVVPGLMSVAATSSADAWSAGDYLAPLDTPQTLIEHWNGSTWSKVSSPDGSGHFNVLTAVAASSASDAW